MLNVNVWEIITMLNEHCMYTETIQYRGLYFSNCELDNRNLGLFYFDKWKLPATRTSLFLFLLFPFFLEFSKCIDIIADESLSEAL